MQPQQNPYAASAASANDDHMVYCRQCKHKILRTDNFCPNCQFPQVPGKEKSKVVAALLAFFLGFFGAHRFYLGQWWGIVYWFFGLFSWIAAIVEGIVFLSTPRESWKMKYGNVKSNAAVIVLISVLGGIIVIGILAAIALPAYSDYQNRTKVSETMVEAEALKRSIGRFVGENGRLPSERTEIDRETPIVGRYAEITMIENAQIEISFNYGGSAMLAGETMVITPSLSGTSVDWDCSGGTLSSAFRPSSCRFGGYSNQQAKSDTKLVDSRDGRFQLRIPDNWSYQSAIGGGEDALLEQGNLYKEQYILIYDNPTADFADYNSAEFADFFVGNMDMKTLFKSKKILLTINGYDSTQISVDAVIEGTDISYFLTFIRTPERIYTVVQWTLIENKNEAKPIFRNVANSFELKTRN